MVCMVAGVGGAGPDGTDSSAAVRSAARQGSGSFGPEQRRRPRNWGLAAASALALTVGERPTPRHQQRRVDAAARGPLVGSAFSAPSAPWPRRMARGRSLGVVRCGAAPARALGTPSVGHSVSTGRGSASAAFAGVGCTVGGLLASRRHVPGVLRRCRTLQCSDDAVAPGALSKHGEQEDWLGTLPVWLWRLVILALCMIWATNFAVIKEITAVPGISTQLYAVSRFTVAATALAPFLFSLSSKEVLLRGIECGSWVAFGYLGQALGLVTTTAAKSCFICSLNVVFVSLVVGLTTRKFDPQAAIAALLAVGGVAFLELVGSQPFVLGDVISLAQPIGFGMGYIRLEQIMADSPKDANGVTATKVMVVALASWAFFLASAGTLPDFSPVLDSPVAMSGILWTGLITTALSLLVESVAFRYVDASSASITFTTEPLWAAIFAVWLISEPFSFADGIGGLLVISANVIKEIPASAVPQWLPIVRESALGKGSSREDVS